VLNGQKTLGTAAHHCQWMSVLARTDPNSKKHAGISCFLVPLDTPGISFGPLDNMAGGRQNHTFFDNVRVPANCLLGDQNQGWNQVWFGQGGERLDRAGPTPDIWQFRLVRMLNEVIAHCAETKRNGIPLSEDPIIRQQLAELVMGAEVVKLAAYEGYSNATTGGAGIARGSRLAVGNINSAYHKEFWPHLAQVCLEIVGPMAQIQGGRWAVLNGRVEKFFRASFGNHAGGTAQLKRMILATRGLGLPR
jgi:alkylation response protein AidB-like acyl-CoA dehydrogenase